jgi:hypothetical protein
MITYCTCSPVMPARSMAALIAKPPSSAPENGRSAPSSLPMGVRAPATITDEASLPEVMIGTPSDQE